MLGQRCGVRRVALAQRLLEPDVGARALGARAVVRGLRLVARAVEDVQAGVHVASLRKHEVRELGNLALEGRGVVAQNVRLRGLRRGLGQCELARGLWGERAGEIGPWAVVSTGWGRRGGGRSALRRQAR